MPKETTPTPRVIGIICCQRSGVSILLFPGPLRRESPTAGKASWRPLPAAVNHCRSAGHPPNYPNCPPTLQRLPAWCNNSPQHDAKGGD